MGTGQRQRSTSAPSRPTTGFPGGPLLSNMESAGWRAQRWRRWQPHSRASSRWSAGTAFIAFSRRERVREALGVSRCTLLDNRAESRRKDALSPAALAYSRDVAFWDVVR